MEHSNIPQRWAQILKDLCSYSKVWRRQRLPEDRLKEVDDPINEVEVHKVIPQRP